MRRQQRVAAQMEKIVPHADSIYSNHLLPYSTQNLFVRGARRGVFFARCSPFRRGQCIAVQLAVGSQRQFFEFNKRARRHILGQLVAERRPQLGAAERLLTRHYYVRRQPLAAEAVTRSKHRALSHSIDLTQRCFNFTKLDAESADLDLAVISAEKVDVAVRHPPDPIAGAIEASSTFRA